jgi:uncharacterized protein YbaA (DUF1428 family)
VNHYLDGFVLTIKRDDLAAYKKIATAAGKIGREHGALEYRECALEDAGAEGMIPFPKLTKAKEDEAVIFAYAAFKSRTHRDAANKAIMADARNAKICSASIVDCKRMAYGGFTTIVSL